MHIPLIHLTKAFNVVSTEGLFAILLKIGCPPRHINIVNQFTPTRKQLSNVMVTFFHLRSNQGYVLAPTVFGIISSMMLKRAFYSSTVIQHQRSDGNLFNPARLKAKRKVNISPLMMLNWFLLMMLNSFKLCPKSADTI